MAHGRRVAAALAVLVLGAAAVVALRLAVGGSGGTGSGGGAGGAATIGVLAWPESSEVWDLRGSRVVVGAIVGVALAVAGVVLQCLLRNPLASPEVLGLSSGASLAVMASIYLAGIGWMAPVLAAMGVNSDPSAAAGLAPIAWQAGPALAGALLSLAVVYALSQRRGAIDPAGLVLVGVVVSIMCGAGVMLLQHLMPGRGFGNQRLLVGTLSDDTTWTQAAVVGAVTLGAAALAWRQGPAMDASYLGDDEAASVGVRLARLRATMFVASGVLAASAVLLAGPVSFVGLICPHVVRLMAGPAASARVMIVGASLAGVCLVVGADALIKAVNLSSGRLPLGVLTALAGGLVFIILLRRTGFAGPEGSGPGRRSAA